MRRVPLYGWLGLLLMLVSEAGMLAGLPPFTVWHTPIAWTGYIFFVDGLVWMRRGTSWLRHAPAELLFLAAVSVPLWIVFELYNTHAINNWYYIGLPESLAIRSVGYAWSFATIWPGIFQTGDLVSSLRDRRAPEDRATPPRPIPLGTAGRLSVVAGLVMLVVPLVSPSPWLAAPVWLGFILLLDPLNARAGDESLRGDWREGRGSRLVNLLLAGLLCGLVWEFWNYWAHAKWIYTVPILPEVKIFEMPILGYLGFPAFALECFVMYVAVRRWIWTGGRRGIAL